MSTDWLTALEPGLLPHVGGAAEAAPPVSFEPLLPRHVEACLALWAAEGMVHEDDPAARALELLELCPGLSWVALRGGLVVGCALAGYYGFAGQIFRVVVDPSQRGQGIGSSLVNRCVESLRERGARRVVLGCEDRLASWYARLGFGPSPARFLVRGL